jgi:hypothetical protein
VGQGAAEAAGGAAGAAADGHGARCRAASHNLIIIVSTSISLLLQLWLLLRFICSNCLTSSALIFSFITIISLAIVPCTPTPLPCGAVVFNVDAVVQHTVKQGERPTKGKTPNLCKNIRSLQNCSTLQQILKSRL